MTVNRVLNDNKQGSSLQHIGSWLDLSAARTEVEKCLKHCMIYQIIQTAHNAIRIFYDNIVCHWHPCRLSLMMTVYIIDTHWVKDTAVLSLECTVKMMVN